MAAGERTWRGTTRLQPGVGTTGPALSTRLRQLLAHEWAKNAIALLIVGAVVGFLSFVVLIGLFRPAVLIGVNGEALAQSLARKADQEFDDCESLGGSRWWCESRSSATVMDLDVNRMGCWHAHAVDRHNSLRRHGCIGVLDVLDNNAPKSGDD